MGRWPINWNMDLTDEEYLVLDGKCRPEVQKYVDRAKSFFAKMEAGMPEWLAVILAEAERAGIMESGYAAGSTCVLCGAVGSHEPLYVRGPKKGQPNPRKRMVYHPRYSVCGRPFCVDCWEIVVDAIRVNVEPLYEVKIQGIETKAVLDVEMRCDRCERTFWKTDVDNRGRWRCPSTNCNGHLCRQRNGETRVISVEALAVARKMMEGA